MSDAATASIVEATRTAFRDFSEKRSRSLGPAYMERMAAEALSRARVLRFAPSVSWPPRPAAGVSRIHVRCKFPALLDGPDASSLCVIGGPADFRQSFARHVPFRLAASLFVAACEVAWGSPTTGTLRTISHWRSWFLRQSEHAYVVQTDDTSALSTLIAKIADSCDNLTTVCVQHGLFHPGYKEDDLEGRNSAINLVYDEWQRREMLRRLPHAVAECIGYPENDFCDRLAQLPELVLVGTGSIYLPKVFARSLAVYAEIVRILAPMALRIHYRPHPYESPSDYRTLPVAARRVPEPHLFDGERRIFIGFASSLLYRAHMAGHLAIALDDSLVPGNTISPMGPRLDSHELDRLPALIERHYRDFNSIEGREPLCRRFDAALLRASQRLRAPGSNTR